MKRTITLLSFLTTMFCFTQATAQHSKKEKQIAYFGKTLPADNNGYTPCVSTEYDSYLDAKYPERQTIQEFENWMAAKIEERKNRFQLKTTNEVITIPVVIHIIHNGDPIGVDENITDEQAISQIQVLNEDFRRLAGTPGFNDHPDGADLEIEFCLAQRDPGGSPTSGIEHIDLGRSSWNSFEAIDGILKAETQWDPERYLNIWVCKMGGEMEGVGGYAYFPQASGLPGLAGSEGTAEIDGVVLAYYGIGSEDIYPEGTYSFGRDKGRSASHEIGHFFGLRHIWGDDNSCFATDYCDDTPPVVGLHFSCNEADTCTEDTKVDMIENHMDYTLDECKNIFTNDQKERVMTVLENSPRRMSLANSNGCIAPEGVEYDGSLFIEDIDTGCSQNFNTQLTLTNIGSETITQAVINYRIDNGDTQIYNWSGSLETNAFETIIISNLTASAGDHIFYADIISVNSITDNYEFNDAKQRSFAYAEGFIYDTETITLNLQNDAWGSEVTWSFKNSTGEILYSGGPYEDEEEAMPPLITEVFEVESNECYTFTIKDEFGDGICCFSGDGYYSLITDDNTTLVTNGDYGFGDKVSFSKPVEMGIDEYTLQGLSIYPNPVNDALYISSKLTGNVSYTIYNNLGQVVANGNTSLNNNTGINTSAFSQGIYIIKINSEGKDKSFKFIKQ
ncbi:T9SS type A sorting domain-containing protein [Flavobacterium beibuense]|uniref:Por secretion system C-terminal sorting domain containing protein n=1 Tax=Flavobacterium beibuense TaxID=657326 RepID=A0A444W752_9FLAO|nr:T9SS type A sorting domain-containing protein [Flavobacterium beibuense]RYJ41684.1 Por secretion system C-terminal sorting domain containing protein [Flavobacterium beibuense]